MGRISRLGWAAYGLAASIVAVDQAVKFWVLYVFDLPARLSVPVAGPFSLTMVMNKGVSFGLLRADQDLGRWALSAFSLVVAAALAVWARNAERRLTAVSLGLIIGGAIGNAIDRIRFGAVVDFLDFSRLMFPWVFNVADSAITVGVVLLLLDSLTGDKSRAG
ncbi:MAG: signal peptidase II [Phenylobacterium sp.]|uniref:signal peptidase II n=1 Tax=Phenylobacterium sp. TaxID=1871053 RepID=UPI003919497A